MPKLAGKQYIDYWRTRIARGPDQVSFNGQHADRQGQDIWQFVSGRLEGLRPGSVLEFGCGYGRMLRRLHALWPAATLYGVDICPAALDSIAQDKNWRECGKPKLSDSIPETRFDLIFDCLALQHVTDDSVFHNLTSKFYTRLNHGGHLVLFENIAFPCAKHVRDMGAPDYMRIWPDLEWTDCGVLMLGFQNHALMIGAKQ